MSELTRFLRERIEKQEQSGWRKKKKEKHSKKTNPKKELQ